MHVQQSRRSGPAPVGNQKNCRDRLNAIQVQYETLERVSVVFLSTDKPRRRRFVVPGNISQQLPQFTPALLLMGSESRRHIGVASKRRPGGNGRRPGSPGRGLQELSSGPGMQSQSHRAGFYIPYLYCLKGLSEVRPAVTEVTFADQFFYTEAAGVNPHLGNLEEVYPVT